MPINISLYKSLGSFSVQKAQNCQERGWQKMLKENYGASTGSRKLDSYIFRCAKAVLFVLNKKSLRSSTKSSGSSKNKSLSDLKVYGKVYDTDKSNQLFKHQSNQFFVDIV